jgi:hypothetical protein
VKLKGYLEQMGTYLLFNGHQGIIIIIIIIITYLLTYLITYLLTYLFTYLLQLNSLPVAVVLTLV